MTKITIHDLECYEKVFFQFKSWYLKKVRDQEYSLEWDVFYNLEFIFQQSVFMEFLSHENDIVEELEEVTLGIEESFKLYNMKLNRRHLL